jgi:glutamate synthase (NADPH/NADH) small chain
MDCVRTAARQGAESVVCLYRRDRANMPGSAREVISAEEEGVSFLWQSQPEALLDVPVEIVEAEATALSGVGRVTGVRAIRTALSQRDADGRQQPRPIADSAFDVPADLVINAVGFRVEDLADVDLSALETAPGGVLATKRAGTMTSLPGVFAAGDVARGPSLAVWAIREGRDAADEIHAWLAQQPASRPLEVADS